MKEEPIVRRMLNVTYTGKRRRARPTLMERRMQDRHDRGGSERGQDNKQGSLEEYDHQLYWRPHMTGQAREEEENATILSISRSVHQPLDLHSLFLFLQLALHVRSNLSELSLSVFLSLFISPSLSSLSIRNGFFLEIQPDPTPRNANNASYVDDVPANTKEV